MAPQQNKPQSCIILSHVFRKQVGNERNIVTTQLSDENLMFRPVYIHLRFLLRIPPLDRCKRVNQLEVFK